MAKKRQPPSSSDYDSEEANAATGFSGFGGHQLVGAMPRSFGMDGLEGEAGNAQVLLREIGVEDAEQLVAIGAIPSAREALRESMGGPEFEALLGLATSILPPTRLNEVSEPDLADRGLGVLPPTRDMVESAWSRAIESDAFEAVSLPPAVNLIQYMSAVRNQQSRGTCVSFTLTAINEYVRRRRGQVINLSEQHLYYEIKRIDGSSASCGTWQAKAVLALLARGQCRETIWPYNPNPPCNNHGALPSQARSDGLRYSLATVPVSPRSVSSIKNHMSSGRPVGVSIPVYNSWYQSAETRRSGRITMRLGNEVSTGGHAICLVGYQDAATSPGGGYFLVRNSWGTTWAYQSPYGAGYGTIPYQYIANENWEAFTVASGSWVAGEDEEDGGAEPIPAGATITIDVAPGIKITIKTGG